ncbi:hypothetical protein X805_20690 [Sphaerotilus natans subsp. natans DSM 6575]|uniref:Secreted protein n=1 Tax=Sphaerotilus natans subsp. natans DSM 6575 TaxID=1286631 RepID=A0A059KLR8_9BURK|nr:hypothetical protein X805_20690 [Sphaerotilus natans subsp. natans DSM 6575]
MVKRPSDKVLALPAKMALLSVWVVASALTCKECDPAAPFFPLIGVTVATEASETTVEVCPHKVVELKAAALSRKVDKPLWILPNDEILALIDVSSVCSVFSGCRSIVINWLMIELTSRPLPRPDAVNAAMTGSFRNQRSKRQRAKPASQFRAQIVKHFQIEDRSEPLAPASHHWISAAAT